MAANSGRAVEQAVQELVDDIRYFADIVKENAQKMLNEAQDLRAYWDDPQYRNFESYVSSLAEDLIRDTSTLYDCADIIEEREIKGL